MTPRGRWLAFDIGCIECSEISGIVGFYATEAEANEAADSAAARQAANWHGQHYFEVFDTHDTASYSTGDSDTEPATFPSEYLIHDAGGVEVQFIEVTP